MSVCALLVAGGLAEVVGSVLSPDTGGDLEDLLAGLQRNVSSLAAHGGGCELHWPVPALPSGQGIHICFRGGSVSASADGATRAAVTVPNIHAWAWDGEPLNKTVIDGLDASCVGLEARTGDILTLSAMTVLVDDCPEQLMFVR